MAGWWGLDRFLLPLLGLRRREDRSGPNPRLREQASWM